MNTTFSSNANWLKPFFSYINLLQFPKEFDVDEDIILYEKISKEIHFNSPPNSKETQKKESNDPILDEVFNLSKEDELLILYKETISDINAFMKELESSIDKINKRFDQPEYQIDTYDEE